jgi:hypothetical protein
LQPSIIDQIVNQFSAYMGVSGHFVIPIGLGLQLHGVALAMRSSLRDDQYRKMSWIKAFGYAVMFVVGMPLVGQGSAAALVWVAPFLASATNILAMLERVTTIDQRIAAISQPWGYVIALLATAFYFFKTRSGLKGRSMIWRPLLQVLFFLIFSHVLFQIAIYAILKSAL